MLSLNVALIKDMLGTTSPQHQQNQQQTQF